MFSKKILCFTLFSLLTILSACKSAPEATPAPPTTDPGIVRTAAVQTADARIEAIPSPTPMPPTPDEAALTQTAEALPTATIEATEAVTDTTQPTAATITPTVTGAAPTAASLPVTGADNATFVKDITIPDNTVVSQGAKFTKTWQFLNAGTSTWTTDYQLAWVSEDQLGSITAVKIPMEVPAGQVVDISVELTAPSTNGTYKSFWRMLNPNGQYFGDAVYVQIKVGENTSNPTPGSSAIVTNLFATVDNGTVSGACPHTFTINVGFDLEEAATVTYQLEAGGFSLTLPEARTESLGAGNYTFTYTLEIAQSGTGWARLHVTSPVDQASSEAAFSLTCQ